MKFLTANSPEEEWTEIDWQAAIERSSVYPYWEGCPLGLDHTDSNRKATNHFLGQGTQHFTDAFNTEISQQNHCSTLMFGVVTDIVHEKTLYTILAEIHYTYWVD